MAERLISCICPTYGRAAALGEAVACFLMQTYRPRELVILNDAPQPILHLDAPGLFRAADDGWEFDGATIRVENANLFGSLGRKYTRLLELARGDYVAHWEDDDLYLPGHLAHCVSALEDQPAIKSDTAHVLAYQAGRWIYQGVQGNVFEAQTAYRVEVGRRLGYGTTDNPCYKLLCKLDNEALVDRAGPAEPTYCFRWDTRVPHGQCVSGDVWRAGQKDFSTTLRVDDVGGYFEMIAGAGDG